MSYDFSALRLQIAAIIYYGAIAGFILGYYITLAKTPYYILLDSCYGAFLGLIFTLAFFLFAQCIPLNRILDSETNRNLLQRIVRFFRKLVKRDTLEQYYPSSLIQKGMEGPISSRTRAKIKN